MINWLEEHMIACFYKQNFGIDCPGCGIQRSLLSLLKGDFAQSFEFYPPLITIIILFLFSVIHILFNLKNGANIIKWIFIIASLSIFINFVFKLIFVSDVCSIHSIGS